MREEFDKGEETIRRRREEEEKIQPGEKGF
jgi:hypothetical protein